MRILLAVPRYNLTNKVSYNYLFPLGLGYISSVMKKGGHEVDCVNLNHFSGSVSEILHRKMSEKRYDFVCTGHMGIGYFAVKAIIDAAKSHPSKPGTILGGAIITSTPKIIFDSLNPDFGVLGEGEETIIDLLDCIGKDGSLNKVKGIIYRENGKGVITEKRELICDLDSIPYPDFEGLEFEKLLKHSSCNRSYENNLLDYPRVYPLLGSRGCPFQCTFCYHSIGSRYRARSMKNIIEEVKWAKEKYKINGLVIYDDLFSLDKKRVFGFCKEIKEIFKDVGGCKWVCQLSVKDVDETFLNVLKDAGCGVISFGFESMSPAVLKSMRKPITPEEIDKAVSLCFKLGMGIQANFIFGDRAETKESAYKTLNYWKKRCRGQVGLDFIQPYPGSEIYNYCLRKGIIKDELEFIKNIGLRTFFNMTEKMSDKEIDQLKNDIVYAVSRYRKSVTASKIHRAGEMHELTARCPHCGHERRYKNYYIKNRIYFTDFMMCENCKMRFNICSPLKKLSTRYYSVLLPVMRGYVGMRNNFLKRRVND